MVWTLCNVVEHEWPRGILRNSIITTLLTKICFIIDEFEINEIFICIKLVNCTTRRDELLLTTVPISLIIIIAHKITLMLV